MSVVKVEDAVMKHRRFDWLPGLILLVWSVFAVIGMVKCIDHTEQQHQREQQLQHKADSLSKRIDINRRMRQELMLKNKEDSIHFFEDGM